MFDQALAVAQTIPELGQPVMPYARKAQALAALGRTAEAKKLLESVLEISNKRTALGYESEALLELAKFEERTGQDTQAIDHFRQAVAAVTKVDGHNLISEADLELSKGFWCKLQLRREMFQNSPFPCNDLRAWPGANRSIISEFAPEPEHKP
jgi:tetratricopeptide (TPR) repeat protein